MKKNRISFINQTIVVLLISIVLVAFLVGFNEYYKEKTKKIATESQKLPLGNGFVYILVGSISLYALACEKSLNKWYLQNNGKRKYPDNTISLGLLVFYGYYNFILFFIPYPMTKSLLKKVISSPDQLDVLYSYIYQYLVLIGGTLPLFLLISYLLSRLVFSSQKNNHRFPYYVILSALLGWVTYFSKYFTNPDYLHVQKEIYSGIYKNKSIFYYLPLYKDISLFYAMGVLIALFSFFMFKKMARNCEKEDNRIIFTDYFVFRFIIILLFVYLIKIYTNLQYVHNIDTFSNIQTVSIIFNSIIFLFLMDYSYTVLREKQSFIGRIILMFADFAFSPGQFQSNDGEENKRIKTNRILFISFIGLVIVLIMLALATMKKNIALMSITITLLLLIILFLSSKDIFLCQKYYIERVYGERGKRK